MGGGQRACRAPACYVVDDGHNDPSIPLSYQGSKSHVFHLSWPCWGIVSLRMKGCFYQVCHARREHSYKTLNAESAVLRAAHHLPMQPVTLYF